MATTIKLKNSVTTTNTPTSLAQGEVAINITDKKVWVGNAATTPIQLLGAGGSASFGALTCTSLTNSGLTSGRVTYATTAGLLTDSANLTFNGTTLTAAAITSTGVATFSAGTVSAPAITTTGDTNTGIFFPAADTIAFTEGGVESMRIDSSGNVGIGTSSPYNNAAFTSLSIGGSKVGFIGLNNASGTMQATIDTFNNQFRIGTNGTTNPIVFITGGTVTEAMRIDSSGNVGIGTSSPSGKLVVRGGNSGTIIADNDGSQFTQILMQRNATANSGGDLLVDGTNSLMSLRMLAVGAMRFCTSASAGDGVERMRITSGGDVGIGVTPSYKFHIKGSGSTSSTLSMYVQNSANTELFFIRDDGAIETGEASLSPYNNTTASAANMLVDSTGRLYRSTSSIKYKTDIQDAIHGLAEVLKLRPVTYKGKKDGDTVFGGLIAEEVDAIGLTEFVQYAKDGSPDALAYGNMVSLLAKAIQEQQAMIEELKQEVALLKAK